MLGFKHCSLLFRKDLYLVHGTKMENGNSQSAKRVRFSKLGLMEYANKARKEGYFNDVTIKVEEKRIPASRMVLSNCSPYFEKMFKSRSRESQARTIELNNLQPRAVSLLIECIYTGLIIINNEIVLELLAAAKYLQLDEVRQFCIEFLKSMLNNDTCCDTLRVAETYKEEELLEEARKFIMNNFEDVKNKQAQLSKSDLVLCIEHLDRTKVNERKIYQFLINWVNHDLSSRSNDFQELFLLLNLGNMLPSFLEDEVSKNPLVVENVTCSKVLKNFIVILNNATPRSARKIISFRGTKMIEVYSTTDGPPTVYPDLPLTIYKVLPGKFNASLYAIGRVHSTIVGKLLMQPTVENRNDIVNNKKLNWTAIEDYEIEGSDSATFFGESLVMIHGTKRSDTTHFVFNQIFNSTNISKLMFYFPQLKNWAEGPELKEHRKNCGLVSLIALYML